MYSIVSVAFSLSIPLAAALTTFMSRPRALGRLLFALTIASYLSALFVPGEPSPVSLSATHFDVRLSWLHPLFLAEALAFAGAMQPRNTLSAHQKPGFCGAVPALWLGLPFISWMCVKVHPALAFTLGAIATALVGAALLGRESQNSEQPTGGGLAGVSPAASVALSGFAVFVQYAAMFSIYSHSLPYLETCAALDAQTASFCMVLFGVGGVLGVTAVWHLSQRYNTVIALTSPAVLAIALLSLQQWAGGVTLAAVLSVMFWGAAHGASMLTIRTVWSQLSFRSTGVASAAHLAFAGTGLLVGTTTSTLFARTAGPASLVGCALTFDAVALIAVAMQVKQLRSTARCYAPKHSIVAGRAT